MVASTRGIEPASLAAPVRELVEEVGLGRGVDVAPLDTYYRTDRGELRFLIVMVGVIVLSVVLLSSAGISAMMSFAVTRRQREIGIRTALGASRRQLISSIFRRSAGQLAAGAAGQHSIRINDQYRVCFRWEGSYAEEVAVTDYH